MEGTSATAAPTQEEKKGTPGNFIEAGQVEKANYSVTQFKDMADVNDDAGQQEQANGEEVKDKSDSQNTNQPAEITEDQLKAYLDKQGIKYDGLESLKAKLVPPATKTPEQIKAEETAKEQRLLAIHIARGGTTEQFVQFKTVAAADPKELGLTKAHEDLIREGFNKEQADLIIKKMHLQYTEEELAELEPEQIEQLKKEAAYGIKKQENRGKYLQQSAQSYLNSLQKEVQAEDELKQKAAQHTSKVEDALKKFVRKQTFQLGEYDGVPLVPVDYDVKDDVLIKVGEILKDPVTLEKTLYNDDGSLNLDFLVPHLVNSVSRETAVKTAFLTGRTNQVEEFEKKFGLVIPKLGSSQTKKGKGEIVSAGQPEVMRRPQ